MKIIHIFHSGFLVRTENSVLVFDCLDKDISKIFTEDDKVYVFISHSHSDHYSRDVFEWERKNSNIKYFLGSDIEMNDKKSNYYTMDVYQSLNIDDLKIQSFGSTDSGVSFLITVDNMKIFHAGDLNWWHWKNDSKEAQRREEEDFKNEVAKLANESIDIAFIPVDPRLGEHYHIAAEYFTKTIKPKVLVPMHFGNEFTITDKIREKLNRYDVEVLRIERKNQELDIRYK
ncbi:MBL fold metallo-hydrolase [Wukongibacter baidiensis]|uniref:MBL fold metallo-hydrolase n=1 Tax=Wukongibacter baidiensis TaxID=1723361 RepID=UPI003D7F2EF7